MCSNSGYESDVGESNIWNSCCNYTRSVNCVSYALWGLYVSLCRTMGCVLLSFLCP